MEELYRVYKDNPKIAIYFIYIREAHPLKDPDARPHRDNPEKITKHKTIEDKVKAALDCSKGLKLSVPFLIDSMDARIQTAYRAAYACTAVVDKEGKIAFHSRGPHGTQPQKAKAAVEALLQKNEPAPER